ncbi:MAG TPA: hypothetical protein VLI90_08060 [Tepidisphaeraceae bacterium]|nr:hypothetical protein [Tepidisphaeraceae bacterium]
MNDADRILDYGTRGPRRSPVPMFGIAVCGLGVFSGILIAGFGVWWFIATGADGAARTVGIIFTGALLIYLCARWYHKARSAMSAA